MKANGKALDSLRDTANLLVELEDILRNDHGADAAQSFLDTACEAQEQLTNVIRQGLWAYVTPEGEEPYFMEDSEPLSPPDSIYRNPS